MSIIHITETTSTNEYLSELQKKEKLEEGTIVWTDFQTAGKGQTGNSWESDPNKNLLFSILFYPDFLEAAEQFILSQAISLAIVDTLKPLLKNKTVSIKWPNDIYVGNKKMVGILIENTIKGSSIDTCIAGIGINVNQEIFKSNTPNPVSLKQLTGETYPLDDLLKTLQNNLLTRYVELCNNNETITVLDYKENLFRKNGYYPYKSSDSVFEAKIKSVLPSGHLVLEKKNGEILKFAFKEVQFLF
jgi:BirA family transcriptional regulator, biotin operon repressor / biotin---[acetyl-CoA-carboxylase] ligase